MHTDYLKSYHYQIKSNQTKPNESLSNNDINISNIMILIKYHHITALNISMTIEDSIKQYFLFYLKGAYNNFWLIFFLKRFSNLISKFSSLFDLEQLR